MHRQIGVDDHALGHRDRAAHQVSTGGLAVHSPRQGGVAAKGLLIEEVAPAAAALPDEKAHSSQVEHGQHRHAPPLAGQTTEQKAANNAAVDGKAAIPDGDHLPDALIFKRCHSHIVGAGADDAQHHADEDDIHHAVRVHAELDAVAERKHQGQAQAHGDAHAVPVDADPADGKGHAVQMKTQSQTRELYQIRHSSSSSSSSAACAVPSG